MNHRITHKLFTVLAAALLLLSALPVTALAASGSTDITATVKHERTMTILPHPHGELLYVAPLTLYAGDEVAFTPVPDEGYALKSIVWYTTDAANATDITAAKKFTMPDADVSVKVEFAEIVAATVGGKVTEGGANVPGAAVKLYLGTAEIAATVTDKDGNYSFYNVEKGTYNIVVTKGDKVKTVLVTVDSSGSFSVNVALPVSAVNSVVELSEGAASVEAKTEVSQIVVGGLDAIAEAETPAPGDKVTIKLTVEPKADANTQEQQAIKREAGNGKKVEFLDLSLWKQVNNNAAQPIGDTNTRLLTIVIPFDFTNVNVSSVKIIRNHSGVTATLGDVSNKNEYGEYVEINEAAGTITLYAMKFSDYAVAYEEQSSGGGGGRGGKTPVSEDAMPFTDVAKNAYYYDAVKWAVKKEITLGKTDTSFDPSGGVTRAQAVTFLWRAAGKPVVNYAMSFVDVPSGAYYAEAVRWAVEQGITKGTSETTFSPNKVCTRAHIVSFLARFAGVKDEAAGYKHGFTDVKAKDYFNNAVAWAKDNKVTEGTTPTTFSPHTDCTRAQVVTFIYRCMAK